MMYNVYSNYSSIISLRKSAFTINELCPSICNCSYCSPFPVNSSRLISINPSLLYGLSQSCLIPSSKIVLGSNDPFCYRSRPIYNVGCCCCCCCCDGEACQEGCCVEDCESNRGDFITRRMGRGDRDFRCNALGNRGDIFMGRVSRGERDFRCNALGVGGKESKGNHGDIIRGRVSRGERDFRCNALGVGIKAGRNDGVGGTRGGIIRRDRDFRCNALGGGVKEGKGNGVDGIRGRIAKHKQDFRCNALRNVGVRVKEKSKDHGVDRINDRIIRYERDALRVGVKESKGNVVGRIRGRTSRSERHFGCNALDEAEAMLSLLSEEGVDECVPDRERNKRSFKDSRNKGRNVVSEKCEDVKNNSNDLSGLGYSESRFKTGGTEYSRVRSREEGRKKREERENVKIDEEKRLRRRESSSSYYSVLDSGEFGSEVEVDVDEDGESSTSQGNDSRKTASVGLIDVTKEEKDQQLINSQQNDVRIGSSTEWDWRKKSEKKLSEESTEVSKSAKESITRQSKMSRVKGSDSTMASSSEKQFSNQEEESVSDVIYRSPLGSSIQTDDTAGEYSKSQFRTGNQVAELLISGNQSETSTSQVSSQEKLQSQTTVENQEITYLKSNQQYEKSSQESRQNVATISSTIKRPIQGEGATVVAQSVQEAGCDYCKTCGQSNQENNIEYDIQQDSELSDIHGDVKRTTSGQSQSESSTKAIVQTGSKKQGELQFTAGKFDTRKFSGQYSKTLESDFIYDQSTSSSQPHTEMQRSNLEVISASSNSSQYGKKMEGSSGVLIKDTESRKLLQTGTKTSHVDSSSLEINRHSASGQITSKEQTHSELKLKEVKEKVGKNKLVSEIFVQTSVRTEQQGSSLQVGHTEKFSGNANASEPDASSIFQPRIQQIDEVEAKNDLQLVVMSPSYQLEQRSSLDSEPSSSFVRGTESTGKITEVKNDLQLVVMSPSYQLEQRSSLDSEASSSFVRGSTGKITEVNTGTGYPQSEARMPLSSWEADESGIGSLTESSPDDRIRSAERMHESSSQIVSEFVDKMRHESSSSRSRAESQLDKINMLTGSTQSQGDKGGFTKDDSTRLSGVSVTSVVEVSELESSESAVSRKTGKSLWNIVSGVFRFRWGSSDSQKSPVKAILKSSSNDSAASETWFSGNEHDDGAGMLQEPTSSKRSPVMRTATRTPQNDNKKKEAISMAEEPISKQPILRRKVTKSRTKKEGSKSQESTMDKSLLRRTTGTSQKGDFIFSSLDDRLSSGEVDVSSFPSASQSGSVSGAVSTREDTDINIVQQPSMSSPLGSSVSSDRQLKRSDASEEIEEAEKVEEHFGSPRDELISSTSGSISPSVAVMETGIPPSEETVAELKQRRLQRSKQVVSDRFDEWEDAFRRENEQRKVDEIFMREALAEAIKAADSWEVPVGAVLVQNGKIIARGYNLVEELRDSTAHAEMICIREASNILRSWRLSDTTLYVTLEPCPMCAGAILQARIKTLVWGAPNKLLGADGSWIRLFPEGAESGERSEVAEKPAAPPHPFHPNMNIRRGVLEPECAQIMQQFFQVRRKKEKAKARKSEEEDQPSCLPVPHSPTKLLRKMHGIFHIMFCL